MSEDLKEVGETEILVLWRKTIPGEGSVYFCFQHGGVLVLYALPIVLLTLAVCCCLLSLPSSWLPVPILHIGENLTLLVLSHF
jgi:hypothetical protein